MAFKTNSEKVENLALQPVGARPYRHQGIDDGMLQADVGAETDAISTRDGEKVIVQLKPRFARETVNAGSITEKIKVERGIITALLCGSAQQFLGNYNL